MQKNSNADNKRTSVADFEFSLNNPQLLAVDEKKDDIINSPHLKIVSERTNPFWPQSQRTP